MNKELGESTVLNKSRLNFDTLIIMLIYSSVMNALQPPITTEFTIWENRFLSS